MSFVKVIQTILKIVGIILLTLGVTGVVLLDTAKDVSKNSKLSLEERIIDKIITEHYEEASILVQDQFGHQPTREELRTLLNSQARPQDTPDFSIQEKIIANTFVLSIILVIIGLIFILLGCGFNILNISFFTGLALLIGGIISTGLLFLFKTLLPILITKLIDNGQLPQVFLQALQEVFRDIFITPMIAGIIIGGCVFGAGLFLIIVSKVIEN